MKTAKKAPAKPETYLGIVEAVAGETLVIVSHDVEQAQRALFKLWRATVYKGFQPGIKDFADLNEWNGARICKVTPGRAYSWDMLEGLPILETPKRPK